MRRCEFVKCVKINSLTDFRLFRMYWVNNRPNAMGIITRIHPSVFRMRFEIRKSHAITFILEVAMETEWTAQFYLLFGFVTRPRSLKIKYAYKYRFLVELTDLCMFACRPKQSTRINVKKSYHFIRLRIQ